MHHTDVIVAGAGPVGTVAAYYLANKGFKVTLCEAGADCAQDLRASTFHPPTLEMLDELGVAESLIDKGLKAPTYHFRERQSGDVIEFDLSELKDQTKFPFRVQCEQHVMASSLARALEQHENCDVLFNHRVTHFQQDQDSVQVAIENPYEMVHLKAKYLIAADGGNSIIRKWLGVEFDGFTYPEKFLTLSTKLELRDHINGLSYVNYVSDPSEWLVLLKVPSVWRILVPASEEQSDEFLTSDKYKEDVLTRLTGQSNVETQHRTIYRVHQRVATKFNHGRVFLTGDSAHLNNPLGGFGMNSGIHDAWNVCERITTCLQSQHDDELFDVFGRQRRKVTHDFIQAQTIQNKALLEHSGTENHQRKLQEMQTIQQDPEKRREFIIKQSMFQSLQDAAAIT